MLEKIFIILHLINEIILSGEIKIVTFKARLEQKMIVPGRRNDIARKCLTRNLMGKSQTEDVPADVRVDENILS